MEAVIRRRDRLTRLERKTGRLPGFPVICSSPDAKNLRAVLRKVQDSAALARNRILDDLASS